MKKLALLLIFICALVCVGCDSTPSKGPDKDSKPVTEVKKEQSFIVYRASADGSEKLLPEKLTVQDNGKPIEYNALVALCSTKPQNAKMDDVFPVGVKVLGLEIKDGIAYADFSKEIKNASKGSYNEMLICYAITNTLTEFKHIQKVQILIEGKKCITLNGHMDIEDPLKRNVTLL
ncbi:MAG: GerMN domain-containing protein [Phascolarctobacterium sp.]|nr:GerMN domain-containing protein [Phascolarctobacterium sp.]